MKMPWLMLKLFMVTIWCSLSIPVCFVSAQVLHNRSGCCLNDTEHAVGQIVTNFEESCLQLVCALNPNQALQSASIVAVQIPPEECSGTPCNDCYDTSCVDESALIRPQGSSWKPNDCLLCECSIGQVINCKPVPVTCPPQPDPACEKVEGPCCPVWECPSDHCVDSEGVIREIDEEWGNLCELNLCTSQGIATRITDCIPVPPFNNSCGLFIPEGQCCPELRCGCVDEDGQIREHGEEWGNPCFRHTCTSSGIISRIEDCSPVPVVNASCKLINREDKCCPELVCGCVDENGQVREIGEEWGDNPCITHTCTSNGIATKIEDCLPLPVVNASCKFFTKEGECCPELRCGCTDDKGVYHELGTEWHPDPCSLYQCLVEGIVKSSRVCSLGPKPDPQCIEVKKEDECCSEWVCETVQSQCLYNGKYYEVGEVFYDPKDPCLKIYCLEGGARTVTINCTYNRPNPWCVGKVPEGECCVEWTCSGCSDEYGGYIPLGREWETDPCTSHVCTNKGEVITKTNCTEPPRPSLLCKLYTPEGECCPQWECPDVDPCSVSFTLPNGTRTDNACVPPPEDPHPNCEIVPVGGCCQELKCGPDCRLVRCGLPEKPREDCELYTPHLACCPQWNCSDACIDDHGVYHQLGEKWNIHPCVTLTCTINGVVSNRVYCRPLDAPPHSNCKKYIPPGKCCEEWKCGDDCNLVDCADAPSSSICTTTYRELSCCPDYNCSQCIDGGRVYDVNEAWPYSYCTLKKCTSNGIITVDVQCPQTVPPNPSCYAYVAEGECCPRWKCGCIDADGNSHPSGSNWEKDCVLYECFENGLVKESPITCNLEEQPQFNCVQFTPPDQCCPRWNCGPNCAVVLCAGPPHKNCAADPLPPLECCPTYTCFDPDSTCEIGSSWEKDCLTYNCTIDGIKVHKTPCYVIPPPSESCELKLFEGQCCLEWDCGYGTAIFPDEAELVIPIPLQV